MNKIVISLLSVPSLNSLLSKGIFLKGSSPCHEFSIYFLVRKKKLHAYICFQEHDSIDFYMVF